MTRRSLNSVEGMGASILFVPAFSFPAFVSLNRVAGRPSRVVRATVAACIADVTACNLAMRQSTEPAPLARVRELG